ncbi:MAG TPA: STAS domain-containing protein [Spirochaetota bacterium]|nr:STAS domain-containing protein [Spirochaetota bacterium]HRZ25428.1 STAS domain-containing protein [Spirochaetota bacterium]HSA15104.1 STAS domain-containing protein [Spirochaetota bacterium]
MKIQAKQQKGDSGRTKYVLSGEATIYSAVDLRQSLADILSSPGDIDLDLGGIEKIDTAGFQLFHLMGREAGRLGRTISFMNLSNEAKRLFDLYCEDHQ